MGLSETKYPKGGNQTNKDSIMIYVSKSSTTTLLNLQSLNALFRFDETPVSPNGRPILGIEATRT